jgi:hypothetical protein
MVQAVYVASAVGVTTRPMLGFFPATAGSMPAGAGLIGIVVFLCTLWCNLALVAAASSPSVQSAGAAMGIGLGRLPAAVGLTFLIGLAAMLLFVPIVIIMVATGFGAGLLAFSHTTLTPGAGFGTAVLLILLFGFLALVVGLWVAARLFLLTPVIVNERLGTGTFLRSFELTRGLVWRIIGIFILFIIVAIVASSAAQAVVGLLARLVLGPNGAIAALVIGQAGSAAVNAAYTAVVATFTAQLYRARTGWEAADTFA